MPDDRVKISALDSASTMETGDLFPVTQERSGVLSTKKATMTQLASEVVNGIEYTTALNTDDKKPIGAINELLDRLIALLPVVSFSATPIATLTDGAENVPMKSLIVDIVPNQASGTPTPSSPLPISGFTGANITHTGKNLANASIVYPEYPEVTEDGKTCRKVTCGSSKIVSLKIFKPNTQYTVKMSAKCVANGTPTVNSRGFVFFYSDNSQSYINFGTESADWADYTATSTSGKTVVSVGTFTSDWRLNIFVDNSKFMLVEGTTITTYEPYTATIYPISWQTEAGTVYGGEVDVTTGKLKVTYGIKLISDCTWNYYSGVFYTDSITDAKVRTDFNIYNIKSPIYDTVATATTTENMPDYSIKGQANSVRVLIKDSRYSTEASFKTAEGDKAIVYELATPIEYTLTPTQIKTRGGTESIFADCGDVSGEYRADIQKYIDGLVNNGGNRSLNSLNLSKGAIEEEPEKEEVKEEEPKEEEKK